MDYQQYILGDCNLDGVFMGGNDPTYLTEALNYCNLYWDEDESIWPEDYSCLWDWLDPGLGATNISSFTLQACACDVTGNDGLSAIDASRINQCMNGVACNTRSSGTCQELSSEDSCIIGQLCDWCPPGEECTGDFPQGCMDESACNYNSTATVDNGSCAYEEDCAGLCGGDAVEDECGVCGGDGIVEGTCDCAGNVLDECGVCGGGGSCQGNTYVGSITVRADSDGDCTTTYPDTTINYYPRCFVCNDGGFGGGYGPTPYQWCGDQAGIDGWPDTVSCADVYWCQSDVDNQIFPDNTMLAFAQCCAAQFGGSYLNYTIELTEQGVGSCNSNWKAESWDCYTDISNFVMGCTDETACNYDTTAQFDDGSCYSGDCINDWYMPGYENTNVHLLSIPIWIDGDGSNDNPTWEDVFVHLCEGNVVLGVLGEGVAALCSNGGWYGSLTGPIDPFAGYWFTHYYSPGPWEYGPFDGTPAWNNNMEIPLHSGNNLMSFPVPSNQPIPLGEAIPNTSDEIYAIVGQGTAALWSPSTSSQAPGPGTGGGSVYDICSGQVDDTWPQITDCLTGCYGEGGLGKQNECGCNSQCDNNNEMGDDYSCNLDFDMSIQSAFQAFFIIDHTQLKIFPEWAGEDSSGDCVQSACVDTFFVLNSENFQLCGSRCGDPNSVFVDIACRHDSEPGWVGPTEVRIFLQRALDGEIYEIFKNPACPDYNDPFIHLGGMTQFTILNQYRVSPGVYEYCGPVIAIPSGIPWESGSWMGNLNTLEFGRGYWVITNNDIDDFNWMGYGNDPRGAIADVHTMDINFPLMNENLEYQDPSTGVYNWNVTDVANYIQEQLSGDVPTDGCSCEGDDSFCGVVTINYENGTYDLETAEYYCSIGVGGVCTWECGDTPIPLKPRPLPKSIGRGGRTTTSKLQRIKKKSKLGKTPRQQSQEGHCKKGYTWNGTECVRMLHPTPQWDNEWHVAPQSFSDHPDLEGGHIQWSNWPWMMSVKAPYTLSLWVYMSDPENDRLWINIGQSAILYFNKNNDGSLSCEWRIPMFDPTRCQQPGTNGFCEGQDEEQAWNIGITFQFPYINFDDIMDNWNHIRFFTEVHESSISYNLYINGISFGDCVDCELDIQHTYLDFEDLRCLLGTCEFDEMAIWDTVVSDGQTRDTSTNTPIDLTNSPNLLHWWRFGDSQWDTTNDPDSDIMVNAVSVDEPFMTNLSNLGSNCEEICYHQVESIVDEVYITSNEPIIYLAERGILSDDLLQHQAYKLTFEAKSNTDQGIIQLNTIGNNTDMTTEYIGEMSSNFKSFGIYFFARTGPFQNTNVEGTYFTTSLGGQFGMDEWDGEVTIKNIEIEHLPGKVFMHRKSLALWDGINYHGNFYTTDNPSGRKLRNGLGDNK